MYSFAHLSQQFFIWPNDENQDFSPNYEVSRRVYASQKSICTFKFVLLCTGSVAILATWANVMKNVINVDTGLPVSIHP